jgi:NAD(P)-dependent dehydrogenase (short-subunit alcohol dehydrogenase family)
MKNVVITGSTSGIGLGLADSFLSFGCSLTISGRSQENLDKAFDFLVSKHDRSRMLAYLCDVTDYEQVCDLWGAAKTHFGNIDIWINNAGVGQPEIAAQEYTPDLVDKIIDTNIKGAIYGSIVALKGMKEQGSGSIYNMQGLGSSGPIIKGLALYGTSKSALGYFTRAVAKETEGTSIIVGGLSPGMVATKLITGQYHDRPEDWERSKRIFNILSDHVETITPWLANKVLDNTENGVNISWLTRFKVLGRFIVAPFHKRQIFD